MPKRKSLSALDAKIERTQEKMVVAKRRYDRLAQELRELKTDREQVRATMIAEAFKKSGKSWEELMTFLSH